jgi:hypothetical protein
MPREDMMRCYPKSDASLSAEFTSFADGFDVLTGFSGTFERVRQRAGPELARSGFKTNINLRAS